VESALVLRRLLLTNNYGGLDWALAKHCCLLYSYCLVCLCRNGQKPDTQITCRWHNRYLGKELNFKVQLVVYCKYSGSPFVIGN